MAKKPAGKDKGKKGPKEKKKQKGTWELYSKEGDKYVAKNKSCPKCGPGYFLAAHKDRSSCGGCGYTEFAKKEAPKDKK